MQGGEPVRERICALQREFTVTTMYEMYVEHCDKVLLSCRLLGLEKYDLHINYFGHSAGPAVGVGQGIIRGRIID